MAKKSPATWIPIKPVNPETLIHIIATGIIRLAGGLLVVFAFLAAMIALTTEF